MATIYKTVTITSQGSTSGPLYDIYYSADGVTYTLCVDGNNVSLPTVGSSVVVSVDDTANFIKAVNLHPGCEGNDVIVNFGGLTTTTTTSGPTTTTTGAPTTTTTQAPTTTTTTLGVNCYIYNWSCDNEYGVPCSLSWTNCDGTPGSDFVSNGSAGNQCARQGTFSISNASFPTEGATCNPTTTTTTTAAPTTTTTTATPTTTTTTTASPIPTGAYVIYDFGNSSSYPGSGATVYDISGNSNNGTLVNSPTWSSTNGGILRLNNASSQRIDYSGQFTADVTTVIVWKNVDSTFSKDTGVPTLRANNGFMAAFLSGGKDFTPILFNNLGSGNTYFSATSTPADITIWHQYAQVATYSSPNTTATTYLDGNTSSATQTQNFARSGTGTGTTYIGFDNAVGDRYANGYIMAYLHYNRALTTTELNSIYTYYSSRF